MRGVVNWFEERTGIGGMVRGFLHEEIPASAGWPQVFGSVALFLFLTQAFTGMLLAINYAPTPGEAHNSLKFIVTQITGGRIIRNLHHWGASLMIVVVVLHMVQVFLFGAYKKPRETTWMVGVVLLLLVLAYGLTGYLLPWDNRAYWGTVVATQIMGSAPVAGPYLLKLLGAAGGGVGVITFARFYGIHVLLLPPATMLLIAFHVYLVRKHGVAPAPGAESLPKVRFFPRQAMKDTAAIFAAFAVLMVMAIAADAPLGALADPTDTSFTPRPEWYFLFLFQLLKVFEGPLEILGSFVLPNLAILLLFAAPFLDRTRVRRVTQRTAAFGTVCLAGLCWGALTFTAAVSLPPGQAVSASSAGGGAESWKQLSPEELAGAGYFRQESCRTCHTLGHGPEKVGPNIGAAPVYRTAAWLIEHFKRPQQLRPGTQMPAIQLSDSQLNALAAFLLRVTPANVDALADAPQFAVEGALVYQQNRCGMCHFVNGVGMKVGPGLNGVASRRDREWLEKHFEDPQSTSPGSVMPPYRFSPREMDRLVSYLLALP